ncbi:hypothetical protein HZS_3078 [Henneguya salminicola]|nr:hypothetical protein HZS_3078 [Henneguya salminicola]
MEFPFLMEALDTYANISFNILDKYVNQLPNLNYIYQFIDSIYNDPSSTILTIGTLFEDETNKRFLSHVSTLNNIVLEFEVTRTTLLTFRI